MKNLAGEPASKDQSKKTSALKEDSTNNDSSDIAPVAASQGQANLDRDIEIYSVEELKKIIPKHYASSIFNTYTHQQLPKMDGPPLELHVDPNVKPYAAHIPASVPAHWEKQVKKDLNRDVALGVIE